MKPKSVAWGESFARTGCRTGFIGKWHVYGSPDGLYGRRLAYIPPEKRFGFEYWKTCECSHEYNHSLAHALRHRRGRRGLRPLRHDPGRGPLPKPGEGYYSTTAIADYAGSRGASAQFTRPMRRTPDAELFAKIGPGEVARAAPWSTLTAEQKAFQRTKMAIHAAMITRMDLEIGKVVRSLGQRRELRAVDPRRRA